MFLQNLRSETATSHLALEQNPFSAALMSEQVTLENYSEYLQKLYGFVSSFEENVFPVLKDVDADLDSRKKSELMQSDLKTLRVDISRIPIVPKEYFKVHFSDVTNSIAGLYVLEGSMLGGVMIKKHLAEKLGHEVDDCTKYLTGYGAETGKVWKNFLTMLSNQAHDIHQEQAIIKSAKNTFDLLNQWISTSSLNKNNDDC